MKQIDINSSCKKTQVYDKKASFSRLVKPEKFEFTDVNDHFEVKRNEENGVFLQRLNRKVWRLMSIIIVSVFLSTLFSCELQESFDYKSSHPTPKLDMTAWEYITWHDSLEIFEQTITKLGLESYYQDATMRTFIAPTNKAFQDYLNDNGYNTIDDVPVPILRNTMRYHIVDSRVTFTDPELTPSNNPIAYPTQNGQIMYLSHDSNFRGLVNEGTNKRWYITTSNLEPTNGIIHVVSDIVYFSAAGGDTSAPDPTLETDTIYPVYDAFINGGTNADVNYGSDILLKVKNVTGDGNFDRKAYLMFDTREFDKEGIVTEMILEMGVKFTHAKGVGMSLYPIADNNWTEMSLTWNNAPAASPDPITTITTTKVSTFRFDCTDYYNGLAEQGQISLMLDGEAGTNETDEFASKEHPSIPIPMMIATLASGAGNLELVTNDDFSVETGGVFVLSKNILETTGAAPEDLIYELKEIPSNGWIIKGVSILQQGDKFTQMDIDAMNLVYINNGSGASDQMVLSVKDKTGSSIDDINVDIIIQ